MTPGLRPVVLEGKVAARKVTLADLLHGAQAAPGVVGAHQL